MKILSKEYKDEYINEVLPDLPDSQYGNLESFVLYSTIRDRGFKNIVEIGTERHSRSSYLIQKALLKNGGEFFHHMCDIEPVIERAKASLFNTDNVSFVAGLIQNTYTGLYLPTVDFLFIDADHPREFARWYLDALIPPLRKGTLVHIHDINLSGDWEWREAPNSEAEEIISRHFAGLLPLEKELWIEDWCINEDYKDEWETLKKDLPFIGNFPAMDLPDAGSASYWRKT